MKKNVVLIANFSLLIITLLMIHSCAQIESPAGGPKDVTPPKVVFSKPANKALNVIDKNITITFDEFVSLTSATEQIVISPIPSETPEFIIRSKSVMIKFKEPFVANKTYSVSFGEAIKDVNENNIFSNYNYLFSTDSILDTLVIKGKLLDSYTLKPVKATSVFLYENYSDTMPYKGMPSYKANVDAKGEFIFNGLKKQSYKIIALADINQDNKFQNLSESVAFIDTLIDPEQYINEKDTSIKTKNTVHELFMFKEKDTIQKIITSKYSKEGCVFLILNLPAKEVKIQPLYNSYTSSSFVEERNESNDTIRMWVATGDIDTIKARVIADSKVLDTITIGIPKKVVKKETKKKDDEEKQFRLNVSNNGTIYYYKPIIIQSNKPLDSIKTNQIQLQESKDTSYVLLKPEIIAKPGSKQVEIKYKWNYLNNYKLFIQPGTFKDIVGNANDTLKIKFGVKPADAFGIVILKLKTLEINKSYVVDLLSEKDQIIQEKTMTNSATLKFENVLPGKYKLRVIFDSNVNGKWDTGSLIKNIQPEKVVYNNDLTTVKENWETEVEW